MERVTDGLVCLMLACAVPACLAAGEAIRLAAAAAWRWARRERGGSDE